MVEVGTKDTGKLLLVKISIWRCYSGSTRWVTIRDIWTTK